MATEYQVLYYASIISRKRSFVPVYEHVTTSYIANSRSPNELETSRRRLEALYLLNQVSSCSLISTVGLYDSAP